MVGLDLEMGTGLSGDFRGTALQIVVATVNGLSTK